MLGSPEPVLHLVHPHPVPWTVVSSTSSQILDIPVIPYDQWLSKLQNAARDAQDDREVVKRNPALLLLEFFEKDLPAETGLVIDTGKAVVVSETLKETRKLGSGDVEKWIRYWAEKGFLSGELHLEESSLPPQPGELPSHPLPSAQGRGWRRWRALLMRVLKGVRSFRLPPRTAEKS